MWLISQKQEINQLPEAVKQKFYQIAGNICLRKGATFFHKHCFPLEARREPNVYPDSYLCINYTNAHLQ